MIDYIVKHRAPVLLVTACIFLFGLFSYATLPRESNPDIKIPVVMVTTPYAGVSPKDVETLVTIPLENELSGVKDLKTMTSTSAEGVSLISLEFEPDIVIEDALQLVRDRVSRAESSIAEDASDTVVQEIALSEVPIMFVNLSGPVDETVLKQYAEDLQEDIERLPEVLRVQLSGGRTRQFRIQANPNRLAHYELGLSDVIGAVANENVNLPGGEVTANNGNFLVRVPGEFKSAREIETVPIKRRGDRPVFVRDVASVVDGFEDRATYSRMNGVPSVSLGIVKRSGANIVDAAQGAKFAADERAKSWAPGVSYQVLADQSRDVDTMVAELENNILLALILVVGVVLFFMGIRNSVFVAVAIPLSMLMGMLVFSLLGITLNMVVLFSLILVLGMLVDNAIVLVENIYRHLEMGKTPVQASIDGAQEVAMAVIASTLTTVAAFAPLLFWTGIMGEFMVYLPITLITVLASSLFVALVILPVLTAIGLRKKKGIAQDTSENPELALKNPLIRFYRNLLERALRYRHVTNVVMFAVLVVTFVAYGELNHGTEFFPDVAPDRAWVTVRAADGTDLEQTDRIMREVEAILLEQDNVETFVAETGVVASDFSSSQATNQGRITVTFYPHASKKQDGETAREEDTRETIKSIRQKVAGIVGAEVKIEKERMGPPVGKPISVEVSAKDYDAAGAAAAKLRRELATIDGVADIEDNYRVGRPELRFRVDRGAAKRIGASTGEIASSVRAAVNGTKASSFRDGEDEYDITVELAPEYKSDLQSVLALRIPGRDPTSPSTFSVPISTVAKYELGGGTGSINHKSQNPVVTISGDVKEGFNENAVREAVVEHLDQVVAAPGISLRLGGANDEQRESQEFMSRALLIALFLIALVLVAQFNSFTLPLVILGSVVLSLAGVLWGLVFTGTAFGVIMTGLGVISLAGVVVNNAIVLLDYVQRLRNRGVERREALLQAGVTRFRPVLLTATTTILGLIPMAINFSFDFRSLQAFTDSQTGEWWGPMAVAVVFGLAFATVLTLIVVPTMYAALDDFAIFRVRAGTSLANLFGKKKQPLEEAS